ncbi:MAG TPA: NAD(P)-dependent oxidoreductase [Caldilineaceae bacterium]|nr:NAD(P)-dependent oxidoreductase [Caldilineaceae bacterium]
MTKQQPTIGFIGLGAMGGPMVRNLVAAGYPVSSFDLDQARLAAAVNAGAQAADTIAGLVAEVDIVMTSLPSSHTFIVVAERDLLPHVRSGQTIIDFGTTSLPKTRELAAAFATKGVDFIDAPVSGGPSGVEQHQLYLFLGGEKVVVDRHMDLFIAIGGPDRITHCGAVGAGQAVKGVNQLMMGLGNAAYLEALAFGVNAGVDAAVIKEALGNTGRWRADLHSTAGQIVDGKGETVGVKFRELPYFLAAAEALGFPLPLTEHLYNICDEGERVVIDDNRPAPSFWRELTQISATPTNNG